MAETERRDAAIAPLRFAVVRDIQMRNLDVLGVLFETPDGGARFELFESAIPRASMLKREYESYDRALDVAARSTLVSATGEERLRA